MWIVQFNLEDALHANGVIESDVKEVNKKQLDNAPKREDDEKTRMMQITGLIQPILVQLFFCEFCEISKNTFSYRTLNNCHLYCNSKYYHSSS